MSFNINPFPGITTFPGVTTTTVVQTQLNTNQNPFKPVKAGNKKSHIVIILDDSSSMQDCRDATISGFNEFLHGQKIDATQSGIETYITLKKFDGRDVSTVFSKKNVNQIEPLTHAQYNPRGSTNLLDAIGLTIQSINDDLKAKRKRDRESVIVAIMTDGEENSSRSFTNNMIKQMVEGCQGKNWAFMFLGANIDAFHTGGAWGLRQDSILNYSTGKMSETFASATRYANGMKASLAAGMDLDTSYSMNAFTDQERKSSGE